MALRFKNRMCQTVLIILFLVLIIDASTQINGCFENIQSVCQYMSDDCCTVDSHNTQIDIVNAESINVREIFKIENTNPSSVNFVNLWLNHSCKNLRIEDSDGLLDFEKLIDSTTYCYLKINFSSTLEYKEQMIFYMSYSLDDLPLAEGSNKFYFEFYSTITHETRLHHLSVILPERSYVNEKNDVTSIYPVNQTQSFIGRRLILSWTQYNLSASINPFYIVRFEMPRNLTWLYVLSPILGVTIGVSSTLWFTRKREKKAIQGMGTVFLNESQRVLLRTILENKGKVAQKDLSRQTGFTRSKISRNLISLEEQGFLTKEKWGRNSLIKLTKSGEKVIE